MSNRFYNNSGPYTIQEIAQIINAEIVGNKDLEIKNIKSLGNASKSDLSFLENKKYLSLFKESKAGACIVSKDHEVSLNNNIALLKVDNVYFSYAKVLDLFYQSKDKKGPSISSSSYVSPTAKIGNNCHIGHNVVIEDNAEIGDDCFINSGTFIDHNVKIGNRARIESNVNISHSEIGDDVVILAGASIGQDGFGFATDKGIHKKILHIGKVLIGNDVEIGANSCVDRGSMNDTVIEDLCRIDNLVQIGHNVHIKTGSIVVSQAGIAGSATIGKYCAVGGQAGVAGHVTITDYVQIAGQGGVLKDIKDPGILGGTPAVPIRDWHRQSIMLKKLIQRK